ncbi:hypothetical protein BCR36DRAFT_318357 [Piromyces finnis]|uniref:Uncharacterized protein n=1 Tax=Piromyces finnis TaxID=1754191 RepID=A0A1Y1VKQ7_9FUNG|nr:hypothetical protein BCR36DRAFT_318357 [Piromyces finnis]|eukprot:ORX57696.1 hypothetical protein BCR36DRAFT_318357 [Piromyces finnis]
MLLSSKVPSSASAYMNPALAAQFDYNSNLTEFHYILEDYVYLQEKLDRLEFASLQLEKQERLTEQVKEKLDNTYDRLSQITNKKKKESAKIEQLKHLSFRSFFSKIKGTRSSELVKAEKAYQNTCKQYEQAKKAFDVNKSLWDESKKELLECQNNNKNFNRYKNELEELLQEVFDGPTPNFPQEDALEQQSIKLFLNFTQLSQVIHQCELAKDNLRNAHMYLVNFFRGSQSIRDYASVWDLSPTLINKILKENERHDELTILSDSKDYVKLANENIQHARVLLTKKTNLTSNRIERLEELFETCIDTQEVKQREGIKRIDSSLEKEIGETRIWLGEEIQNLKNDYTKQEKELATCKTKLFEERQQILNLWVVNLDESVKKRMIENSSARGRKRSKSKILKSYGQSDESDSNWFDTSGITCAADLAVRNNTISRNASVKSSTTLYNKEMDSLKVGSYPLSNGFYTLSNINQYMGSSSSLEYHHDPLYNSLPRWPFNHQNNSLYTIPDNINNFGMDFSAPSIKAQSEIIKNHDVKFSDSQSQGEDNNSQFHDGNDGNSESKSNTQENSNNSIKKIDKSSIKHNNTYNSKKSFPSRSNTKNSHTSNNYCHATTSAININGIRSNNDYSVSNLLNTSFDSLPNSLGMMGGYSQNTIPRLHSNGSNYMYNRYSMEYPIQYYPYNNSVSDMNANAMYNPYIMNNSILSSSMATSLPTTSLNISPHNSFGMVNSNTSNNNPSVSFASNTNNNNAPIQRSRSSIVKHVMDRPLNRNVISETINLNNSNSANNTNENTPNIAQLQQSPMFPFPQRSRSVSVLNSKDKRKSNLFSFHKNNIQNYSSSYDTTKVLQNRDIKHSFSKRHIVSLEDITGSTSVAQDDENNRQSVEIIHRSDKSEKDEVSSSTSSLSESSSTSVSSSSSSSSSLSSSSSSESFSESFSESNNESIKKPEETEIESELETNEKRDIIKNSELEN